MEGNINIIIALLIMGLSSLNLLAQNEKYVFLDTSFNISTNTNEIICNLESYAHNLKWNRGSGILAKDVDQSITFTTEEYSYSSKFVLNLKRDLRVIKDRKILDKQTAYLIQNNNSYQYVIKKKGLNTDSTTIHLNDVFAREYKPSGDKKKYGQREDSYGYFLKEVDEPSCTWENCLLRISKGDLIAQDSTGVLDTMFVAEDNLFMDEVFCSPSHLIMVSTGKYSKIQVISKNISIGLPIKGKHVQISPNRKTLFFLFPTQRKIQNRYRVYTLFSYNLSDGSMEGIRECLDFLILD